MHAYKSLIPHYAVRQSIILLLAALKLISRIQIRPTRYKLGWPTLKMGQRFLITLNTYTADFISHI